MSFIQICHVSMSQVVVFELDYLLVKIQMFFYGSESDKIPTEPLSDYSCVCLSHQFSPKILEENISIWHIPNYAYRFQVLFVFQRKKKEKNSVNKPILILEANQ